jgi:hypothetical protein
VLDDADSLDRLNRLLSFLLLIERNLSNESVWIQTGIGPVSALYWRPVSTMPVRFQYYDLTTPQASRVLLHLALLSRKSSKLQLLHSLFRCSPLLLWLLEPEELSGQCEHLFHVLNRRLGRGVFRSLLRGFRAFRAFRAISVPVRPIRGLNCPS